MEIKTDVVIVGTGVGGAFSALNLPEDKQILMITKSDLESSDSFLAQGGICVLRDDEDYEGYFEDTMRAGHYENRKESVDIMIRSSQEIIHDLIEYGVDFAKKDGNLAFTREGAHSRPRILFHEDITGKEITSKLLMHVKKRKNVQIHEYTTMTDIIVKNGKCAGILAKTADGEEMKIYAQDTIFASGGIGGRYQHSTNFPHLTGDALDISRKHGIRLEHLDYVQIHPTTLYSSKPGRRFLISESVRGEGAVLYNKDGERFVNELLLVFLDHSCRDFYQETGQHNETQMVLVYLCQKRLIKRVAALIVLRGNAQGFHTVLLCPFQGIGARIVADDYCNLGIGDLACIHCIQNCL